jgi:3-methyladenine DNA glycosylase AlkD
MNYLEIRKKCQELANPAKAKIYYRYFQTQKGGYGFGDVFYGLTVPECRLIAKVFSQVSFKVLRQLLQSKYHEERFIALVILTLQFDSNKERVYKFYLNNLNKVNNWDLVDVSAYKIVGIYLISNPHEKSILQKLIKSTNMWERRIALVSTLSLIKNNQFNDTLNLAREVLQDKEDLIHKAAGWMLREIGKKDEKALIKFLDNYYQQMPRVMLRYSLEKVINKERYLKKPLKKN